MLTAKVQHILSHASHSSHATCSGGTYIWTVVSCHSYSQENVAAPPRGHHKKGVERQTKCPIAVSVPSKSAVLAFPGVGWCSGGVRRRIWRGGGTGPGGYRGRTRRRRGRPSTRPAAAPPSPAARAPPPGPRPPRPRGRPRTTRALCTRCAATQCGRTPGRAGGWGCSVLLRQQQKGAVGGHRGVPPTGPASVANPRVLLKGGGRGGMGVWGCPPPPPGRRP